ncbi:kinase [Paenibacillus nicotianae]|uniref:Kinase n=1 Tax=Paenibacillus nicotianae TaxID=1526551 RepID=A0ABW4UUL4_9BACL
MKKFLNNNKKGIGYSFGTFGELLQGVLPDNNIDFLVSFPITKYSCVTFYPDAFLSSLQIIPAFKTKSLVLAEKILAYYNLPSGGIINVDSHLPIGKGLASSSADLVACARAIDQAYDLDMTEKDIQRFMMDIEPSDGVMHDGVVSFYHKKVQLKDFIGQIPKMTVVSIDEGGMIETLKFNRIHKPFTEQDKYEYDHLLKQLTIAIREMNYEKVGQISTRSAEMNQKLLPKRTLKYVQEICNIVGGLGVIVAHSGTCIGILFSSFYENYDFKLQQSITLMSKLGMEVSVYHSWDNENANTSYAKAERGVKQNEI